MIPGTTAVDAAEHVDLSDPELVTDPYPRLAELRARAPLAWHSGLDLHLATGHAVCSEVLRSRDLGRTFTPRRPAAAFHAFNWLHAHAILENEPPTHTRLRRLVQAAFGRGHVARLQPRIETLARGLLEDCAAELADRGSFDVVSGYAEPLPVLVIADLVGWPVADRALLRPWSQAMVKMYEVERSAADEQAAQRASEEFADYVLRLAGERARRPGADLISDLVGVRDGSDRLSDRELVATVVLLLNAGHEASVNGLGNGLASLLGSGAGPDAGHDPAALVEEMLRHDSPLQLFERTAARDTSIAGVTIRRGERVAALLGAANRDPTVFERPDEFSPGRDPNPQLAFGAGIHFCLGAPLARLELQTSVRLLLERWPRLEVTERVRRPTFVLRGYRSLRLRPQRS